MKWDQLDREEGWSFPCRGRSFCEGPEVGSSMAPVSSLCLGHGQQRRKKGEIMLDGLKSCS